MTPAAGPPGALAAGRYVRALNLHVTPAARAGALEATLAALAERFVPVGEDELVRLLATGVWDADRPGLLVCVFNGYREGAEVAAPILERVGFVGWFFVCTGWVEAPAGEQRAFAERHGIALAGPDPPDGRLALSWPEIVALGERHVIASHTRTHAEPVPGTPSSVLEAEALGSRADLAARLGRPVRTFAWRGGLPIGVDPAVDAVLARSGYALIVSNAAVQRLPRV